MAPSAPFLLTALASSLSSANPCSFFAVLLSYSSSDEVRQNIPGDSAGNSSRMESAGNRVSKGKWHSSRRGDERAAEQKESRQDQQLTSNLNSLQLKKVINRVASELEELGLTSEVLKDLLAEREPAVAEASNGSSGARRPSSTSPTRPRSNTIRELNAEAGDDVKEDADVMVEAVVSEDSSEDDGAELDGLSARQRGKRRKTSKRRATASYELAGELSSPDLSFALRGAPQEADLTRCIAIGTTDNPEPRIRIVFSSASSGSDSYSDSTDSSFQAGLLNGRGSRNRHRSPSTGSGSDKSSRFQELPDSSEDEKQDGPSGESSEVASADDRDEIEGDFEGAGPQANKLLKKMYGVGAHSDDEEEDHEQDWASVGVRVEPRAVGRKKSDETLRWEGLSTQEQVEEATRAEKKRVKEERAANGDEDADDEGEKRPRR